LPRKNTNLISTCIVFNRRLPSSTPNLSHLNPRLDIPSSLKMKDHKSDTTSNATVSDGLALARRESLSAPHTHVCPDETPDHLIVGHHVALERNFTFWDCLGIALTCLNSITAMSASLSLVLPSGGPVAMIYGIIVSACGTLCMAASLAEICHVYPTAGGQYEWVYIMAPEGWKSSLSFVTGWMATAGWVSLAATGSSLGANLIVP
jgi:hypothetical protein